MMIDVEYRASARYSELLEIHKIMSTLYPYAGNLPFPKKRFLGNNTPSCVTDRAVELLRYFDLIFLNIELSQFWLSQPVFTQHREDDSLPF
eukprot:m.557662 g.557662  ORF g.557662 m.557662 type:complete len:91 (-) comp57758_c1_seq4:134-406(-)